MNATQTAQIHQYLLAERERIFAEWKNHGGDAATDNDWDLQDLEEQATRITTDAVDQRITHDDLRLLRKVELAIQRLTAGTYEQCAHCGQPIPLERLLAKPAVSLCLACQQLKDAAKR